MRRQFKDTITELAATDDRIVVILGDISHHAFKDYQAKFPARFFNMGICENALVSIAAGLSAQGFHPIVHTIAPFITERSLEQIKVDMSYNGFGGNIASTGGSFDYAWDGPTHHCYTDLAILRLIPGVEVIQPGSEADFDTLFRRLYNNGRTTYFRLSDNPHQIKTACEFGRAQVLKDAGGQVTVMTAGPILAEVLAGTANLPVNVVYFTTIKPIDVETIQRFRQTKIIVINDAYGLHEAVCEVPGLNVSSYGPPQEFSTTYGTVHDIRRSLGLDPASIAAHVSAALRS